MAIVNVYVNKRIASVDAGVELVCNNPTDTINFVFDEEWAAYPSKIATFAWDGGYQDKAFVGNQVQTPEIFNTNYVFVGVYADGIASTPAKVNCKRSILCIRGNKRSVPNQADFTEIMKAADEVAKYNDRFLTVEGDIDALENYEKRPYELTGNPIQMQNYEGMPFGTVETQFSPKQAGSGDPSPTNIRPISGYDSLNLTRCGKNLLNPAKYGISRTENGVTITVNADGTVLLNGTATAVTTFNFFMGNNSNEKSYLKAGQTYTMSCGNAFAKIPGSARMVLGYKVNYEDDWAYPINDFGVESATCILPKDATYTLMRIRLSAGDVCNNVLVTPQIEAGTQATPFEPFKQGNTYIAQIGKTVYGGKMNWLTGELTAKWACVDAADVSWSLSGAFVYVNSLNREIKGAFTCSHYMNAGLLNNSDVPSFDKSVSRYSGNKYIRIFDSDYTSAAEYTAYFAAQSAAGTPVQIAYELAEPEIIQLTPQQIAALDGTNTFYGDGEITVAGRKDILWLTSSLIERIKTLEEAVVSLGGNV